MSVPIARYFVCWAMVLIVPLALLGQTPDQTSPAQTPAGQAPVSQPQAAQTPISQAPAQGEAASAILHTQGGVWVNGYEAKDSSAIFAGDLLETKVGFSATLTLEGTTVTMQPESVAKFQDDALLLDHGSVAVGTSKSYKVKVNCITVVPVLNDWTQYEVTDVNGTVQVNARKLDVNVSHETTGKQLTPGTPTPDTQTSRDASVHESEQKSYNVTELCGAPPELAHPGSGVNPKWIAAGAGGAGVLLLILLHGGGSKTPMSASAP